MNADLSAEAPGNQSLLLRLDQLERQLEAYQQQAKAREDRLRMILESAVDYAIVALDLNGLVIEWNEGARRILGWNAMEMLGKPASVFFTEADRQAGIPEAEMRAAEREGRGTDERWHIRKDGSLFWANGEMMPLRDGGDTLQGFIKVLRDRTVQREAAEKNRADAEFLRSVLASSGDCIKVLDLDARLTFMTENGQRIMEVDDFNAIRGCPWPDFWQDRGNADARTAVEAARSGAIGHFRGAADTFAGTSKYWDVQVTPIFGVDGRPERLLSVSRDITAMHQAEVELLEAADQRAALVELDDRLRDLDDLADMSFAAAEIMGRTLRVSRAGYCTIDGNPEVAEIQRDWTAPGFQSVAGRHELRAYGSYIENLNRGEPVIISDIDHDSRTAADTSALHAIATRALVNLPIVEHGRLVAMFFINCEQSRAWTEEEVAFLSNVAERTRSAIERRRAEQSLRMFAASLEQQVEARTRERDQLWNSARDLLIVADYGGRILRINPAWKDVLAWSDDQLLADGYYKLIHPDDLPIVMTSLRTMRNSGTPVSYENRVRAGSGEWHTISWQISPEESGDRLTAIGRDVTERKRLEDQLRQSQKMEAVGQLTGGLAHDFNNLLTGITGSLELLSTRIAQGRIKDVDRYVGAAQGAAKRAAALTHRLLAFSRRQTLEPKPTDVKRLVSGMQELIERTTGPEIQIETEMAGGLWSTVVDPGQLENALLNLCINARDAMPDGGRLSIETENRWLDERAARERDLPAGQYVSLCVSDNGTGMTPDVVARAFDPFFTTKPIRVGTGLGLSMIYGFARQSGGQVRIYSEVGQGTMVCIYLPRHLGEAEVADQQAELSDAPRAEAGETVLVIDDEPTVRMLVTEVLKDLGYTAIEAADGAAGLQVLQSDVRIDLLVTDVGLPGGMNGRQVADAARVARPDLKVLFITGYAENAVLSHGHLDPGMHVLTKPFALEALAKRIKELIATF